MSEQEDNGLTLEGLAQRLEALEQAEEAQRMEELERREPSMVGQGSILEGLAQRVEALEGENALLRQEAEALRAFSGRGRRGEPASEFAAPARKRSLLRRAAGAALGVVRSYSYFDQVFCDYMQARYIEPDGIGVFGGTVWTEQYTAGRWAVLGRNTKADSSGFIGGGRTGGVRGEASAEGGTGVYGKGQRTGVRGEGPRTGVEGHAGPASASGGFAGSAGVVGTTSSSFASSGVFGAALFPSAGHGVVGQGNGPDYAGVRGSSDSGYGGFFTGARAPLRLFPASSAGRPTGNHRKGELYMDSNAALYVCTAEGTPGTWRRFTTTAA